MIYLDNAATTFPKPESVYKKMDWANRNLAVNAGRGSYKVAREATKIIDETRKMLVDIVHGIGSEKAILTPSATIAIHIILNGMKFNNGDSIYVSPYEHNAVARCLNMIANEKEINIIEIPLKENSFAIDIEKLNYLFIKKRPKCICVTHVSNVTGYILPVKEIFKLGKEYGAFTVLDASQSFGLVDINIHDLAVNYVAFAGHKTLYGPFGASGFIDCSSEILSVSIAGGTGSDSLNLDMPQLSPDRYEAASKDIVAICGLHEALSLLNQASNYKKEKELTNYLVDKLKLLSNVTLYLPESVENHIGVVSFNVKGYKSEDVGMILDGDFDIAVRTGYHCAPFIHKYLHDDGYLGTVRIGLSQFNTKDDVDILIDAISDL